MRRNHLDLIEFGACHYGVGEFLAGLGTTAAGASAATGAGAAGASLAGTALGTSGLSVAGGAGSVAGLAAGAAAPTALTVAGGAGASSGFLSSLSAFITGPLATGLKVALPLASAGSAVSGAIDADKQGKAQARQAKRRGEAEAQESLGRAQAMLAANDVGTAARGVVGGAGSPRSSTDQILRGVGAEQADIADNTRSLDAVYGYARRRAKVLGLARASRNVFNAGVNASDFF